MPIESPWVPICPGINRRTLSAGDKMMQVLAVLDAGSRMPEHRHVHEQIATCIKGRLRLVVEGKPIDLHPGESFYLGSNVPHSAAADEETHVIDTFSPPREDMLELDRKARQG